MHAFACMEYAMHFPKFAMGMCAQRFMLPRSTTCAAVRDETESNACMLENGLSSLMCEVRYELHADHDVLTGRCVTVCLFVDHGCVTHVECLCCVQCSTGSGHERQGVR
jgi:hypothetical protein